LSFLPPTQRGKRHSYYFKVTRQEEGVTRIMGPYPTPQQAIAAKEAMRYKGYLVGEIVND